MPLGEAAGLRYTDGVAISELRKADPDLLKRSVSVISTIRNDHILEQRIEPCTKAEPDRCGACIMRLAGGARVQEILIDA